MNSIYGKYSLHNFAYTIRCVLSKCIWAIYKIVRGNIQSYFNENGLQYFVDLEMSPEFNPKPFLYKWNPYFLKWGIKVPSVVSEYYSQMSGIRSDLYLTRNIAFNYIYPYLTRYEFIPAYADKNMETRLLDIHKVKKEIAIHLPETVVNNVNGIFFDQNDNEIDKENAIKIILLHQDDMIIKPSTGTYGGKGVMKINRKELTEKTIKKLLEQYNSNYTIQQIVKQHPDLASFNESSVNTIRIVTFRNSQKKRRILYSLIRYGGKGAINDNVCSGGGFTVINPNGKLKNRIKHVYKTMKCPTLQPEAINEIPYWNRIKEAALLLHGKLPHFDIVGWDFSLTSEGIPVLIEYNIRPGVGLQQAVGPMFTQEELDDIMSKVSKMKAQFESYPSVTFPDKLGFKSNWIK